MNKGLLYFLLLSLFCSLNLWSEEALISFDPGFSLRCPEGWFYQNHDLPPTLSLEDDLSAHPALTLYNYDFNKTEQTGGPTYLKKFPLRVYKRGTGDFKSFIQAFTRELTSLHAEPIPVKEVVTEAKSLAGHNVQICRITYSSNVTVLTLFIATGQFILEFTQYIELNKDNPQPLDKVNYLSPDTIDSELLTIIKGLNLQQPLPLPLFSPIVALRMREKPSLQGRFIRYLAEEERLVVLEVGPAALIAGLEGNWVKVKTATGEEGWCFNGYLEEVK